MHNEGLKINISVIWNDEKVDKIATKEWMKEQVADGNDISKFSEQEIYDWIHRERYKHPIKTDWMRVYSMEEARDLYHTDWSFVLLETPMQRTTRIRALEAKQGKSATKIEEQQAKATTSESVEKPAAPTNSVVDIYKSTTKHYESNVAFVKGLEIGKVYEIPLERQEANLPAAARQNKIRVSTKIINGVKTITRLS